MPLKFVFGPSGSGKSTYLYQHVIEESEKYPQENFIVLVPEQFTMQTQKDLVSMHPRHGIMNIDILSFARLAYRVFEETGTKQMQVLDDEGKNLILRKIAGDYEDKLTVLKGNIKKLGYISEVKSVISEFTQYDIGEEEMDEMLDDLMELGVTPVIAHPERYRCVQESESGIAKWKNRGCLLQVNRGSIFGRFGSGAKQCVDRLLDQHMVTCIASDAHKPYERTTYMADIKEYMEQEYSFEYSKELLYDNPKRILEGEKVVQ